jgi:hypothetical protein
VNKRRTIFFEVEVDPRNFPKEVADIIEAELAANASYQEVINKKDDRERGDLPDLCRVMIFGKAIEEKILEIQGVTKVRWPGVH